MKPYYADDLVTVHAGDCLDVLRSLPDCSVDAVVTDPPYGLGFMGKEWDSGKSFVERKPAKANTFDHVGGNHNPSNSVDAARTRRVESRKFGDWCETWAAECLRVLKPGGHMLAFGGTRTSHRLACAVEDAGFEIRDSIAWLYGSGFPKSLDVSKAIDKAAGHWRGKAGEILSENDSLGAPNYERTPKGDPVTAAAAAAAGWGTALKPAFEPVVVARKPLVGTVAANFQTHRTGALNIGASRVGDEPRVNEPMGAPENSYGGYAATATATATAGRWPANVILDESQADVLDEQSGETQARIDRPRGADHGDGWGMTVTGAEYDDHGGASRFFYVAKADASERVRVNGTAHPTVKPLALMRWLVRLVTPPGGTVLEPFAGSGTTVEACLLEGFQCIAIEREADYLPLIVQRINRRRDPVAAVKASADDGGLFDLLEEGA